MEPQKGSANNREHNVPGRQYRDFVAKAKALHGTGVTMKRVDSLRVHIAVGDAGKVEEVLSALLEWSEGSIDKKLDVLNGKPLDSSMAAKWARTVNTPSEFEKLSASCWPLQIAGFNGDYDMMKLLMDHGAKLETQGEEGVSVFHVLATGGHSEVIAKLAADLVPYVARSLTTQKCFGYQTPLFLAVDGGHTNAARELLEMGADPNVLPSALHVALRRDMAIVVELLNRGANAQIPDSTGSTPLHLAMRQPSVTPEVVEALLKAGAQPQARDPQRATPLHYCVNPEIMTKLIASGAKTMVFDLQNRTPLHYCARGGSAECITILLSNGADLDAVCNDPQQTTALHCAAAAGNLEAAKVLLATGADPKVKLNTANSRTVFQVATSAEMRNLFTFFGKSKLAPGDDEKEKNAVLVAESLTKQLEEQQKQNQLLSQQNEDLRRDKQTQQKQLDIASQSNEDLRRDKEAQQKQIDDQRKEIETLRSTIGLLGRKIVLEELSSPVQDITPEPLPYDGSSVTTESAAPATDSSSTASTSVTTTTQDDGYSDLSAVMKDEVKEDVEESAVDGVV